VQAIARTCTDWNRQKKACAHVAMLNRFRILCVISGISLASQVARCQQPQGKNQKLSEGRAVFLQHCAVCHGDEGQGVSSVVEVAGPDLQAVHKKGEVVYMAEVGSPGFKSTGTMPSFAKSLSLAQIYSVADYVTEQLATIPLQGGNVSDGGRLFREYCSVCHRTAVRGGALAFTGVNAPSLVGMDRSLVAGAIRSGPGPMPKFPASEVSNKQLDSIVDYVEFVQHPPSPGGNPLNWYGPVAEGFAAWVILCALICLTFWIEKGGQG
jgi:ubiquinol-cytochrome c reductase cytochrome c subunit